jgi:hypothetical protein
MSRHKPKRGQDHPPHGEKKPEGNEKSTNRHVYVEPGVQIDLVEDLKQKYETAQSANATHSNKILFWTKISAALLFIYAGLTLVQSCQAIKSANAAKSAADTAKQALHVSERPYIFNGLPVIDLGAKTVTWDIINSGHIPSRLGDLGTQSILRNRTGKGSPWYTDECHLHRTVAISVAPGAVNNRDIILFRKMSEYAIQEGLQKLMVYGHFSYNDGFADDPTETVPICLESVYFIGLKKIEMVSCLSPDLYLNQPDMFVNCEDDTVISTKPDD